MKKKNNFSVFPHFFEIILNLNRRFFSRLCRDSINHDLVTCEKIWLILICPSAFSKPVFRKGRRSDLKVSRLANLLNRDSETSRNRLNHGFSRFRTISKKNGGDDRVLKYPPIIKSRLSRQKALHLCYIIKKWNAIQI